jgi:four helix bundle protein
MATFQRFEDMQVWQKTRELTRLIYHITKQGDFVKDFGLRDQIRRASISVMSNIVEGYERNGNGEFLQFLTVAKGSAGEIRAQLYIALDQHYIDQPTFDQLAALACEVSKLLSGLINYLNHTPHKGLRFRKL